MLPFAWLHVNGVSLSPDSHQHALHASDSRAKHVASPIQPSTPPMISSPSSIPFTATANDGQQTHRQQYHKIDSVDLPKKLFLDRQIKKVKSLPGLIKGTALSRNTSLHSAPNSNQLESNALSTNNQSNTVPCNSRDTDNESSPSRQHHEQATETRRTRVSFSDNNKVQFFEDNDEVSKQHLTHRRHRHRSSKKSTALLAHNFVSPPSIQHSQTLHTPYRPSSRQQQIGQELNIKKQFLFPSPRGNSSRMAHLPEILNQALSVETPIHEKYFFNRDRGPFQVTDPAYEIPVQSSTDISRESTRAGGVRSTTIQDSHEQNNRLELNDGGISSFLVSSSMSSSLSNRQRSLRAISLRHQFTTPVKPKSINTLSSQSIIANPRRSSSFKHLTTRLNSVEDDQEERSNEPLILTSDNRPVTSSSPTKSPKANYVIHFNAKPPSNGQPAIDSNEKARQSIRTNFHESSQDRFQNMLKIARPPYVTSINTSHHEPKIPTPLTNNANGSVRSSRTNSGHGSHEFHIATNTITV